MFTLYFCLDDNPPVIRVWSIVPRVGETVALPELGGNLRTLKVVDVVYEGYDEPSVSVYLHHVRREQNEREHVGAADDVAGR